MILTKIISIILATVTFFSYNVKIKEDSTKNITQIPGVQETENIEINPDNSFNQNLIELMENGSLKNENYTMSPLSLKYALSMLTAGVTGEAKEELLKAMNYSTETQMLNDIEKITQDVKNLEKPIEDRLKYYDENPEKELEEMKKEYQTLQSEQNELKEKFKKITKIDLTDYKDVYYLPEKEYEKYEKFKEQMNKKDRKDLETLEFDISDKEYKLNAILDDMTHLESLLKPIQFNIVNSVWYNETVGGNRKVKDDFKNKLSKYFSAEYYSEKGNNFSSKINKWVQEKTNNKINSIADKTNDVETILALINAIYMKADWETEFRDYNTNPDTFTTINNEKVEKEFMFDIFGDIPYYEDEETQIVGLTFRGQSTMYFVLGDTTNIEEKIKKCKPEREVHIHLPKFEMETEINEDMKTILSKLGVSKIFEENPETFKEMFTSSENISISDIIQKTFLKVEERGIEAAAVTAIMTCGATAIEEEYKPKVFKADKPFSFYIYTDDENNNPEHLAFFGQYVK